MADRPAWITQHLPGLIREGVSGAEALRRLRGAGVAIRTQSFYRAWGETKAALASWSQVAEAPLGRRPVGAEITEYSSRHGSRGYLYSFDVLVRNRSTGEVYYTPSGFRTNRLVRYETAMQGAVDAIAMADPEGSPELADMQVIGAVPLEVREYVPEDM